MNLTITIQSLELFSLDADIVVGNSAAFEFSVSISTDTM